MQINVEMNKKHQNISSLWLKRKVLRPWWEVSSHAFLTKPLLCIQQLTGDTWGFCRVDGNSCLPHCWELDRSGIVGSVWAKLTF